MINEADISNAIGDHLASTIHEIEFIWENSKTDSLPALPYIAVEIVRTGTTDATIDGTSPISRGYAQITVVSKLGEFATPALSIASDVATIFRYMTTLDANPGRVTIMKPPFIQQGYPDGVNWRTPVRIDYEAS